MDTFRVLGCNDGVDCTDDDDCCAGGGCSNSDADDVDCFI